MEIDKIYNIDCLEGMKHIPDGSIDAIICDLPYGTMQKVLRGNDRSVMDWDIALPTMELFEQYERVLRKNGVAVLFSQEPYTNHLRSFQYRNTNFEFAYPMIWEKDSFGNHLIAGYAPASYFEDLSIFFKKYDGGEHPAREYAKEIMRYCGVKSCKQVNEFLGHRHAEHFFYVDSMQFDLCTKETYQELIDRYHIDKMQGFKTYEEMVAMDAKYQRVFNLPAGKGHKSNILKYAKDTDGFHPTQKPVALIADLIRTYSNEGDTILDNCMGSGTTAVACIKEKRHFIGFELNKQYYDKACQRIDAEQRQLTLF